MSSTTTNLELFINAEEYIKSLNYTMFIAGLIGNSLNILLFTKLKIFRNNRCVFYLIMESIVDICMLFLYYIPQLWELIYGIDPGDFSLIWCKIRTTLIQPCRLLISSIVCFQAFDQYLSTHYQLYIRQFSTFRLARNLISISYCIWFLQSIPYIIYYEIIPGFGCIIINITLIEYYSYVYYIFLNGLIPIVISCLFSLLAYRNVRHIIENQIPIERRLDHQMTAMIFTRVIVFIILRIPYTIFRIYILNVILSPSDNFSNMINQLISVIVTTILMWNYSLNFYIFLFISSRYRRQVKYFIVKKCWQTIKTYFQLNHNNEIQPSGVTSSESGIE